LGVVKVGLFWLAKPEVICQRMIFTKKEVRCKINYRSTLTTPI